MTTHGLLQLGNLTPVVKVAMLLILLAAAAWFDIKSRRIPNWLVLVGLIASLLLQINLDGFEGFKAWGAGLIVGFVLFLPLYLLRAMGAGDVKLMAMVGAFLGPFFVLGAALATLVVGGILAIAMAVYSGAFVQTMKNVRTMLTVGMYKTLSGGGVQLDAPAASAGSLPYGVAIAMGTLIQQILMGNFRALFS
jgi:prepilin peptidase CpaA